MPSTRSRLHRLVALAGLALLTIVTWPNTADSARSDQVWINFNQARAGRPLTAPVNGGVLASSTTVAVVTLNGGSIRAVTSFSGQGQAGDFPDFNGSSTGPRAVIRVVNRPGVSADGMNPGTARLEYGADITIDALSAGGGTTDDGNNVIQRGLFNDVAQFKLEVDNRIPRCRSKGDGGASEVASTVTLTAGARYRVRCVRSSGQLSVRVTPITAAGTLGTTTTTAVPDLSGNLAFAASTPLAVGGKLNPNGTIAASASDQFNGTIDNAILRIG